MRINYRYISSILSLTSLGLLVVAHCSHSWRTYQPLVGYYTMGLWTICSDNMECRKLHAGQANMEFTRAFMLLALISSFLAVIWSIEWDHLCHCHFTFLPKALLSSIFNLVAGLSLLIGLVMFEIESTRIPEKTSFKNWAFYLSCANGFLCFLIATLDFVAYKCSLWETNHVCPEHEEAKEPPTVAPALL
ncbi:uncharacterized protein LOC143838992 [Paroedura picta]|uniref:uncharacterized protein LOC143838992 n=1 Tax=Paroedura picta TaxID=143630 RepID=UPI00405603EE